MPTCWERAEGCATALRTATFAISCQLQLLATAWALVCYDLFSHVYRPQGDANNEDGADEDAPVVVGAKVCSHAQMIPAQHAHVCLPAVERTGSKVSRLDLGLHPF